ncbi:MAG TPA: PAS domain-containing protein [Terriglobales bacterium]|nr:PAS domain-containing protein [Terriglobales bacterium]
MASPGHESDSKQLLEAQLRATLDVIPAYTWYADPSGALTFINKRHADYLGLPKDHPLRFGIATGAAWDSHIPLLHPDDHEEARRVWSTCLRTGSAAEMPFRVRNAAGEYRWFLTRAEPLRASDGTLLYWIGVNLEIDDAKRAEDALRKSEKKLREVVDTIPALIHTARPDGYIDYFNNRWLEYLGVTLNEVAGWKWTAVIHAEDVEGILARWRACLITGEIFEYETRVRGANGEYRWMFHRKVPLRDGNGSIVKWYGSSMDIHERKTAEEALRSSEAYLAEAQKLSQTGSFGWKPDTGDIVWSDETYRIFEYDHAMKPTIDLLVRRVHPEDRPNFLKVIESASAGATGFEHTYRWLLPDGSIKHVHALAHALQDASGNREFVGAATDITSIKRAEEELRTSEAYLAEAQRLSQTGSWAWNPVTGDIRYWSEECYRVLGFDPHGPLPRFETFFQRLHADDQAPVREQYEKAIRDKADFEFDYRLVHPDKGVRDIHVVGRAVLNQSGDLDEFVGTVIDITERKRAEQELQQLVDLVPQMSAVLGPDGKCIHANRMAREYTGLTLEEFRSKEVIGRATHPDDVERARIVRERGLAGNEPFEFDARVLGKDGNYRWFLWRYNPSVEEGRVRRWYVSATEIESRKQEEERVRQENVRLEERTRIAQELHDTLLQNFLSASMQLGATVNGVPSESPVKGRLDRVLQLMEQGIEDGRKALQGLRLPDTAPLDLIQAFSGIQRELAVPSDVEFRISVIGEKRPLHFAIQHEIYRIGREALINAFRHSRATRVEVDLEYADSDLRMKVRDNGCGVDPRVLDAGREGHWGLAGMQERATKIGGLLKIYSNASAGTEVELSIPSSIALELSLPNRLSA